MPTMPTRDTGPTTRHTSRRRRSPRLLRAALLAASALTIASVGATSSDARTVTPSVAIQVLPTQRVAAGGTAQYPFLLRTAGNTGTVSFEATGIPVGATAEVVNLGGGRYELDVRIAANAPVSSSTITLRARSKAKLQSTAVYLEVLAGPQIQPPVPALPVPPVTVPPATTAPTTTPAAAAPVFGLRSDNPERTSAAGQTATFGVTVDRSSGYSGAVGFSVSGIPAGSSANFAPNPTTSNSVLYLTPSATTIDGRYTITITGTAGTTTPTLRVVTAVLVVQNQPDFAIDVPASATANIGAVTNIVLGYRSLSATATPTVSLALAGLPAGAAAYFSPNPTFGRSTLVISLPSSATVGTYPLTITGTAGTITHTYTMSLIVSGAAGFGISATPSALAIARGAAGSVVVTIVPSGGFSGAVSVTVGGLPSGPVVTPVSSTNQVTLTIAVPVGTVADTYPITITGTSGSLTATVGITLTIT